MPRYDRYEPPRPGEWRRNIKTKAWEWFPGERHSAMLIRNVWGSGYIARYMGGHADRGTCTPVIPDGLEIPEGVDGENGVLGVVEFAQAGVWAFMPEGMYLTPSPRG